MTVPGHTLVTPGRNSTVRSRHSRAHARECSCTRHPRVVVLCLFALSSPRYNLARVLPHFVQTLSQKCRNTDLPPATNTKRHAKCRKHCFRLLSSHQPQCARIFGTLCAVQRHPTCKSPVFGTLDDCHLPPLKQVAVLLESNR